jgi:hypothetical protein
LREYLNRTFPGSQFDEGYSFVFLRAPFARRATEEDYQPIVDDLCVGDSWLVAVNVDWKLVGPVKQHEVDTILYTPDWNIEEKYDEHIAIIDAPFPAEPLLRSTRTPGALALINPRQDLMFNMTLGRLYGKTNVDLDAFCARHPRGFHPRDPAYGE